MKKVFDVELHSQVLNKYPQILSSTWERGYFTCSNTLLHCLCALCMHIKSMWLWHPSYSVDLFMVKKIINSAQG